jgi:hypothetical protein
MNDVQMKLKVSNVIDDSNDVFQKKNVREELQIPDSGHFQGWAENPDYRRALEEYMHNPTVMLELNSRCNFHCHYCRSPQSSRQKSFMDPNLFRYLLPQLKGVTSHPIRLHLDGEPTLHPQFLDLCLEANDAGHRICLATNASNLKLDFLKIDMDVVVNLSCSADEFSQRTAMRFDAYLARIKDYIAHWAIGSSRQNLIFRIYTSAVERASVEAIDAKKAFAPDFIGQLGIVAEGCWAGDKGRESYTFSKKEKGLFSLAFQPLTEGGLYPDISGIANRGMMSPAERGFCDSAWKVLVVLSDGVISCCCVDLTAQMGYTEPEEIWHTGLKELWLEHPAIKRFRENCLSGRMEFSTCRECLGNIANRELYIFPELFPFTGGISRGANQEEKRK